MYEESKPADATIYKQSYNVDSFDVMRHVAYCCCSELCELSMQQFLKQNINSGCGSVCGRNEIAATIFRASTTGCGGRDVGVLMDGTTKEPILILKHKETLLKQGFFEAER